MPLAYVLRGKSESPPAAAGKGLARLLSWLVGTGRRRRQHVESIEKEGSVNL
jgi:hypothetical protein